MSHILKILSSYLGTWRKDIDTDIWRGILVENIDLEMKKMENIKIGVTEVGFEDDSVAGVAQSVAKRRLDKHPATEYATIQCFLWGPRRYRCYAMVR
jgi:hypothetical protein